MISLFKPVLSPDIPLKDVFDSGQLAEGPRVQQFELELEKLLGYPVVTTNSGTSALHLAYILAGVKENSIVISTPMTCLWGESLVAVPGRLKMPTIKSLVRSKYNGLVYTEKDGKLTLGRVVGWHRTPVGNRRWMFISHRHSKTVNSGRRRGVFVTDDHPILTTRGYVKAKELEFTDTLILAKQGLSEEQEGFITGSMLGDGSLSHHGRGHARMTLGHAKSQEEWITIKRDYLIHFGGNIRERPARRGHQASLTYQTLPGPIWTMMRSYWYRGHRKIVPDLKPSDLTWRALATWYMDDGSLASNTAGWLCCEGFTPKERDRLVRLMRGMGINAFRGPSSGKAGRRILIRGIETGLTEQSRPRTQLYIPCKFFSGIAPYVPPSMRYKLPKEIEQAIPYRPELWKAEEPPLMRSQVTRTHLVPKFRHKKWAYCLDVEGTHNFSSSDVIVHNCLATNLPLLHLGARIIWADVDEDGLIDPVSVSEILAWGKYVRIHPRILVGVEYGGLLCDWQMLEQLASPKGMLTVSDSSHAWLAQGDESRTDIRTFSFQAIKHLTTGDGGALSGTKAQLEEARLLRWFGLDRSKGGFRCEQEVSEVGYKFHMNDIAASIGLANLPHSIASVEWSRDNARFYSEALKDIDGLELPRPRLDTNPSWWSYVLRVPPKSRQKFIELMAEQGVQCARIHSRNDVHPIFKNAITPFPLKGVERFDSMQVSIPVGYHVSHKDREHIAEAIRRSKCW